MVMSKDVKNPCASVCLLEQHASSSSGDNAESNFELSVVE